MSHSMQLYSVQEVHFQGFVAVREINRTFDIYIVVIYLLRVLKRSTLDMKCLDVGDRWQIDGLNWT